MINERGERMSSNLMRDETFEFSVLGFEFDGLEEVVWLPGSFREQVNGRESLEGKKLCIE